MKNKNSIGILRIFLSLTIPFGAFALQYLFWVAIKPYVWFLFFPAVFFSSRIGGLRGGLGSTVISTLLVWWYFIPPTHSFAVERPITLVSIGIFIGMGVLFSLSHEALRVAKLDAEEALARARSANEDLQNANEKITALLEKTKELDEIKTQFFANVSHELRTPLTLILGPIGKMLANDALRGETRSHLEMVERNARLLYRHVSDLLDVAKMEAGRMTIYYSHADISHLSRVMASHFESLAAEKEIRFTVDVPAVMHGQLDVEKFQRILLNLLSNAFKFTPQGGEIGVILSEENGRAILRVRDSGPGVPPALRSAVFERFRQVEGGEQRKHGGTGLGLAIVAEFCDLHGGTHEVETPPGGGALFTVTLPLKAPAGSTIHATAGQIDKELDHQALDELRETKTSRLTETETLSSDVSLVLVVEDNPDMNAYIAEVLGKHFRVATAFDGEEGLKKARALKPDLILCDVMMPKMSGSELVEALRAHLETVNVPIVMLTAKADDTLRVEMLKKGAQDFLTKPFLEEELLARVEGLMAKSREAAAVRAQMAAIVDSSDDAVIGKTLEGVITSWNRGATRLFNYAEREAIGATIYKMFSPEWKNKEPEFMGLIRRGQAINNFETEGIRKDGSRFAVSIAISPIMDPQGRVTGASLIGRDITKQKEITEALRRLNAELEQRVRERTAELELANRELREFVFVASHDLQEPLRKITGFGERLGEHSRERLDEKEKDYLGRMLNAASRMQTLIEDLLTLSRITTKARPFETVDLRQALDGVLQDMELQMEKSGAKVHIGPLDSIEADPTQIRQLLQNILGNSLKFRKEGVTPEVHIRSERNPQPAHVAGHAYPPGGLCIILVKDNGIGFEQKYSDKIFVVFQRLHGRDEYAGTGVGLAICKKIAERHKGTIAAFGSPGEGAEFKIMLPVKQPE